MVLEPFPDRDGVPSVLLSAWEQQHLSVSAQLLRGLHTAGVGGGVSFLKFDACIWSKIKENILV